MKRVTLLRVEQSPAHFDELVTALKAQSARVGWLSLDDDTAGTLVAPALEAAASGSLRAVAVGGGRVVSLKKTTGPPVLKDLVREHFLGCRIVLVFGPIDAPLLRREESGDWSVVPQDGASHLEAMDTDAVVRFLLGPKGL